MPTMNAAEGDMSIIWRDGLLETSEARLYPMIAVAIASVRTHPA